MGLFRSDAYRQFKTNQFLNEQRRRIEGLRSGLQSQYSDMFSSTLERRTGELMTQFDEFFNADLESRNALVSRASDQVDLGNSSIAEFAAQESQLAQALRSGRVDSNRVATTAEISNLRRSLRNLDNLDLQEDTTEVTVLDLQGNQVSLSDLDLDALSSDRYTAEQSQVNPDILEQVQALRSEYNNAQSTDQPTFTLGFTQLLSKYGDRDDETLARLISQYGDTDINLAAFDDNELSQYVDLQYSIQQDTYGILNESLDSLERDELLRRYSVGVLRENERIQRNEEIRRARQQFAEQADQLRGTLGSLGLTSEQLQARDDLSQEGSVGDARPQQVVTTTQPARGGAPRFQPRPL